MPGRFKPASQPGGDEQKCFGTSDKSNVGRQKAMKETIEKNLAAGKAFMEANAKMTGVKTLPSGLQYNVISEGKGKKPTIDSTVVVNYRGTLVDGTEFDSTARTGQPATFPVKNVISGWTEALQLMKAGSKWQLFIPANLAYGERGPLAGQTLIFDVELLEVK
jgi:FKBP-type peptidyl-prolyl cis-trans isomerase FklB